MSGSDQVLCRECDDCHDVFSHLAYVMDLVDFVADSWGITLDALEDILLQAIRNLNCETGLEVVQQIVLGIEVLEKYLGPRTVASTSATWREQYFATCERLLQLVDYASAEDLERALDDGTIPGEYRALFDAVVSRSPILSSLECVLGGIRDLYESMVIQNRPLPSEPDTNAPTDEQEQYLREIDRVTEERQRLLREFEARIVEITSPAVVLYREELIRVSGENVADLENKLFIDLRAAPCHITTRMTQLIQSLQSFVLSIRTGEIEEIDREDLKSLIRDIDLDEFDEASWEWLHSYATWWIAMYVLVYPENVLSPPTVRRDITPGFEKAVKEMAVVSSSKTVDNALETYDQLLGTLGRLCPVSAHVMDDRVFVFACSDNALWVGEMDCSSHSWSGWTQRKELGEDEYLTGIVPVAEDGSTRFFGCVMKDESCSDRYRISSFWLSLEGDIEEGPKNDIRKYGRKNDRFHRIDLAILYLDGHLRPTLAVPDELSDENENHVVFLNRDNWKRDDPTWKQWSDIKQYTGIVIGGNRYFASTLQQGSVEIRAVGPPSSRGEATTTDADGSCLSQAILATNFQRSETNQPSKTHLLCRSEAGTLFAHSMSLPSELANLSISDDPIVLSTPADVMSNAIERWRDDKSVLPLASKQVYFEERYLHCPLLAASALNRAGDYASAHEWYRKLYDPFTVEESRHQFPFDTYFAGGLERAEDWLTDPLNPHAIARQRSGAYLRHVILMMVQNLLGWADHEFAMAGPESLNRARELYLLAERVLKAPELGDLCEEGQAALEFEILEGYTRAGWALGTIDQLLVHISRLNEVNSLEILQEARDKIREILRTTRAAWAVLQKVDEVIEWALEQESKRTDRDMGRMHAERRGKWADRENEVLLSVTDELAEYLGPRTVPVRFYPAFCIPANPSLQILRSAIEVNLSKLRECRTFDGERAPTSPLPAGGAEGVSISDLGQLPILSGATVIDPPRYRYGYLVEKARQQVGIAQQLGAALLSAVEKRDQEDYNLLLAENALEVAGATVSLRGLMATEAKDAKLIADDQLKAADRRKFFWEERVKNGFMGLSAAETAGMGLMGLSGIVQTLIVYPLVQTTAVGALASLAGLVSTATGVGAAVGIPLEMAGLIATATGLVAGGQQMATALQTFGQLSLTFAGFERRWEDWKLQNDLASYDYDIADHQVTLAQDRIDIADKEKEISETQHAQATAVLGFLKNKDANRELYEWMIGVLQLNYRVVMQIAASTARLAQAALEFERQGRIALIQGDYWTISANSLSEKQKELGLLGAERLLSDLARLDDYKLSTDRRRLQLSKTISLAQMLPTEFVGFREAGEIEFNTLLNWFDWDFPGHYMRLIKSVRVTVLALVPPTEGIHAMLTNEGTSTVVVCENGSFVHKRSLRAFGEAIALDSPCNETGLFVLDYGDPMLLPFEGLGVETGWRFSLPRATNRFDFSTIVDVLFTIEYTAVHDEHDETYKEQVIRRLGDTLDTEVVISLRTNYPDEWYHLNNPIDPAVGQTVVMNISRNTLPPNLKQLRTRHLTAVIVGEGGRQKLDGLTITRKKFVFSVGSQFESDLNPGPLSEALRQACENEGLSFSQNTSVAPGAVTGEWLIADQANQRTFVVKKQRDVLAISEVLVEIPIHTDQQGLFSTRQASVTNPFDSRAIDPAAEWEIFFDRSLYDGSGGGRSIDSIEDIVLAFAVEGKVIWN